MENHTIKKKRDARKKKLSQTWKYFFQGGPIIYVLNNKNFIVMFILSDTIIDWPKIYRNVLNV